MATILREERYIVSIGLEEHVLRVQQLISGSDSWPQRFRVQIPASEDRKANTMYGSTGKEVAERAVDYLNLFSGANVWLRHAKAS